MRTILVAALASAVATAAFAVNTSVFMDAPITRLSAEELKAFLLFVDKTLDEGKDGVMVQWKAPKTQFVSKLTPHSSFTESELRCREITIESDSHDRFQRGRYVFCKNNDGAWRLKSPRARPATTKQ